MPGEPIRVARQCLGLDRVVQWNHLMVLAACLRRNGYAQAALTHSVVACNCRSAETWATRLISRRSCTPQGHCFSRSAAGSGPVGRTMPSSKQQCTAWGRFRRRSLKLASSVWTRIPEPSALVDKPPSKPSSLTSKTTSRTAGVLAPCAFCDNRYSTDPTPCGATVE